MTEINNMSDIKNIKDLLVEELKWFPTLADDRIFQVATSLLTTIESQKEEIEKWRKMYGQEREFSTKFQQERDDAVRKSVFWEDHCGNSELRIESLKAITELAVKEIELLKQSKADVEHNRRLLSEELQLAVKGLEDVKNVHKYGSMSLEVRIAANTLLEIKRLSQ